MNISDADARTVNRVLGDILRPGRDHTPNDSVTQGHLDRRLKGFADLNAKHKTRLDGHALNIQIHEKRLDQHSAQLVEATLTAAAAAKGLKDIVKAHFDLETRVDRMLLEVRDEEIKSLTQRVKRLEEVVTRLNSQGPDCISALSV